jgi:hypothetical protein
MTDTLTKIGGALGGGQTSQGGIAGAITGGMNIFSQLNNFIQGMARKAYQNRVVAFQKQMATLANNPALYAQKMKELVMPLTAGETAMIQNQVQAWAGEHGLTTSPQILDQVLAQALSPLVAQRYQMAQTALQQVFGDQAASLGLGMPDQSTQLQGGASFGGGPSATTTNPVGTPTASQPVPGVPMGPAPTAPGTIPGQTLPSPFDNPGITEGGNFGTPFLNPADTSGGSY